MLIRYHPPFGGRGVELQPQLRARQRKNDSKKADRGAALGEMQFVTKKRKNGPGGGRGWGRFRFRER